MNFKCVDCGEDKGKYMCWLCEQYFCEKCASFNGVKEHETCENCQQDCVDGFGGTSIESEHK